MRVRLTLAPVALAVLVGSGACARRLPDAVVRGGWVDVACCGQTDGVEVVYLGVGGWLLRHRGSAILTAPLYSNPSLVATGVGRVLAVPERIEAHLPDVSDVTAILVGHGHYDHLLDVPYVMERRAPRAVVLGNRTMAHQLAPFGVDPRRVRVVEDAAGSVERPGRWMDAGPAVRVMPLVSEHAPHFAGVTLYSGERTRDMEEPPNIAGEWLDGATLAWLIDFLDGDGRTAFRVYYQDAVAAPLFGFPPVPDDGHGVDLALLVPATYAEVSWHPERFLRLVRPRQVILGHWEDFFQPPSAPVRAVPFTDLDDFLARLRRTLPDGNWHLGVPGTSFRFR